jgi:hypothetical protein
MRTSWARNGLGVVVLFCLLAANHAELLTPAEYTQRCVAAWSKKHPEMKVEVLRDLELVISGPEGKVQSSLQRSYETYAQEPERLAELIDRFVHAESLTPHAPGVARERIIPVIKTRAWLAARPTPLAHEDFSSDLVVIYAEDFPDFTEFLSPADLEGAGLTLESLKPLAVKNLLTILDIEPHSYPCCHMLTAGGDYEASLILADSILQEYQKKVKGSLIVSIPASDLFLLTGSENEKGVALLKETIEDHRAQGTLLTGRLFLYEGGKLREMAAEK